MWKKSHPDTVLANRAVNLFNDNVMSYFRKNLTTQAKTISIGQVFTERKNEKKHQSQRREETAERQLPEVFMEGVEIMPLLPSLSPLMPSHRNRKGTDIIQCRYVKFTSITFFFLLTLLYLLYCLNKHFYIKI